MDPLERHLTTPRPNGHGWTTDQIETVGRPNLRDAHLGDHRGLGKYAGHEHSEMKK